jgi:hypothetical protein
VEVSGGTVTLSNDTIDGNVAFGGTGDPFPGGGGFGGGIYIASTATVYIDTFTVAKTTNNTSGNIVYGT